MLSTKIKSSETVTLIENDEDIKTEKGTAKVFFSNVPQNVNIQQYNVDDHICENINDPLLKAIVTYQKHPSIVAIKKLCNYKSHFSFEELSNRKKSKRAK